MATASSLSHADIEHLVLATYNVSGEWPTRITLHPDDAAVYWRAQALQLLFNPLEPEVCIVAGRRLELRVDSQTPRGTVFATRHDEGE